MLGTSGFAGASSSSSAAKAVPAEIARQSSPIATARAKPGDAMGRDGTRDNPTRGDLMTEPLLDGT
jgi:hypothetical protein